MKGIDYTAMRFWFDIVQTLGVIFLAIYTYMANRTKANRSAIDDLQQGISNLSGRVDVLDADMRHLPNHQDIGEIHEKINEVGRNTSQMSGELVAINRTLSLINEHLINNGRRK